MREKGIASIVEGDGEVEAVPALLRKIILEIDPTCWLSIPRGFKQTSGTLQKHGGLERAVEAIARLHPGHAILIMLDSDDSCPRELGPKLADRARRCRPDVRTGVVLPNKEFEPWFLASAETLAGKRDLSQTFYPPEDAESVRDAKGRLTEHMPKGRRYSPTQDQAALVDSLDFDLVRRRSRSFRKLWSEVEKLLTEAFPVS